MGRVEWRLKAGGQIWVALLAVCLCAGEVVAAPVEPAVSSTSIVLAPTVGYGRGYPLGGWPSTHGLSFGAEGGVLLSKHHLLALKMNALVLSRVNSPNDSDDFHGVFSTFAVYRYAVWFRDRVAFGVGAGVGFSAQDGCYGSGDVCGPGNGFAWIAQLTLGVRVTRRLTVGYFTDLWWQLNGSNGIDVIMFNAHSAGVTLEL